MNGDSYPCKIGLKCESDPKSNGYNGACFDVQGKLNCIRKKIYRNINLSHQSFIILIQFKIISEDQYNSESGCSCIEHEYKGYGYENGKCLKDFRGGSICYINNDATCSDKAFSAGAKKYYSWIACEN